MDKERGVHVKALEPGTLLLSILVSVASAAICMQIISRIGFTPNTSIIGALIAMSVARLPFAYMDRFRSLDRQNLVQTMVSGAGFSASNCTLMAVAILYVFGDISLLYPMLIGAGLATVIGMHMVYSVYDSELFPAAAPWPPGVATAQALIAGDQGGKKGRTLLFGLLLGAVGSSQLFAFPQWGIKSLPMAGMGIAFIANTFAMIALGLGLIFRGFFPEISAFFSPFTASFGVELPSDLAKTYIPHGFMVGAGIISLVQALQVILRKKPAAAAKEALEYSVSTGTVKRMLVRHSMLFALAAVLLAVMAGLWTGMSGGKLALWIFWCTFSATVAPILVGLSAMHSGWFPGFAVTTIFLVFGIFMDFPPLALLLLTGFVGSTGPCFADMGFDLKTGWLIRGKGANPAYELDGRRQQVIAEVIGGLIAVILTALVMDIHFKLGLLPPVSKVFVATIKAGLNPAILNQLLLGAFFGAVLQFAGGPRKSIGILFSTGLLINSPVYGIGLLVAVALRHILERRVPKEHLEIVGGGLVAGDGLYGFAGAIFRAF